MTRKNVITVIGTTAVVVAGTVGIYIANPSMPKSQGFDPVSLTATAQNRATIRLAWQEKHSPFNYPVKYNRIRVYEERYPGCVKIPDAGPWKCVYASDAGVAACRRYDGGTRPCTYTADAGPPPLTDGGLNWDAGTPTCYCDRDGGVRDSGAPGIWSEKLPSRSTVHTIPCSAIGAACPRDWFTHGWTE